MREKRAPAPIFEHLDSATLERFWAKVDRSNGPDACWGWTGAIAGGGYGQLQVGGRMVVSHRIALTIQLGRDIRSGMQAGHSCHDRAAAAGECDGGRGCPHRNCTNPSHLIEQTCQENNMSSPNTVAAQQSSRTHCPAGHELSGKNLLPDVLAKGRRGCRTCNKRRNSARVELVMAARDVLGLSPKDYKSRYGQARSVAVGILLDHGIDVEDAVAQAEDSAALKNQEPLEDVA